MTDKKKRPPLMFPGKSTTDVEKFHESHVGEKPVLCDPPEGGWDSSYVPGFSDLRHMNEELKKKGKKPVPLPANVLWVRSTGKDDYRGMIEYRRQGYEIVNDATPEGTSETLNRYGYGLPPAAQIMPDGTIRRDDVILAWCTGEQHAKNVKQHEEYRRWRSGSSPSEDIEMTTEVEEKLEVSDQDVSWE
jgi:hypothetical protein